MAREFAAHVTIRLQSGLPSLRDLAMFEVVLAALTASAFGLFFRIVEYSVQRNHVHLLIEASDSISMTAGMRATGVRLAAAINSHLGRRGPVIADRFHWREIKSPRDARNALLYVLNNARKHALEAGVPIPIDWIDPRSSAAWFTGWSDAEPKQLRSDAKPVANARTWLLTTGWRKFWPLISVREVPKTERAAPSQEETRLIARTR